MAAQSSARCSANSFTASLNWASVIKGSSDSTLSETGSSLAYDVLQNREIVLGLIKSPVSSTVPFDQWASVNASSGSSVQYANTTTGPASSLYLSIQDSDLSLAINSTNLAASTSLLVTTGSSYAGKLVVSAFRSGTSGFSADASGNTPPCVVVH